MTRPLQPAEPIAVPDLTAEAFAASAAYAGEALRRWSLTPDWLDGTQSSDDPTLPLDDRLRRRRQLESLRILWDELRGRHDAETTGQRLSALARSCLADALAEAERRVEASHGRLPGGARLAVMALGKLGGDELNFNSDLDLVFVHDAHGESDGRRGLAARDWLTRVARELSTLMETVTARGRAWVIDTRLRPFGSAGALVWSLDAMEQYVLNEGRAWERYAWLKAGLAAGDPDVGAELLERLQPFVFRRYLDYGLFDSLRDLHAEIDRKSRRDDLADDVKRGPGGIRELEFLVQSLQLLRGGHDRALRRPGFLPALSAAAGLQLLTRDEAIALDRDYRYLRTLENRLQAVTGRQTHRLPESDETRAALARLMGERDWPALYETQRAVRARVRTAFRARFEAAAVDGSTAGMPWPPGEDVQARLVELGFQAPAEAATALTRLAERLARRPLSAEARRRLDRLMPELLEQVIALEAPETGFADLLGLVETVAQRSAYLSLLHERPRTLERTVRVFRRSERVARWVTDSPQLLDDLLDPINGFELPEPPAMLMDDIESSLNALARFRQAGFVRTALGQLDGALDRDRARSQLTRLAEAVLGCVAQLTLGESSDVALIGYGNLGAGELHYSSDLDLVFLHAGGDPPLRGIQRLINALQLPLPGGRLYEVDTRLRPNGNAGLLVTGIEPFERYQLEQAWCWEHQALIRARVVDGPDALRVEFERIRHEVLCRPRELGPTRQALAEMRVRQRQQRVETPMRGVLGDIQFIAELGVLLCARDTPSLTEQRRTGDQIEALAGCGWLDADLADTLLALHGEACDVRDRAFLERAPAQAEIGALEAAAGQAWHRVFGDAG